MQKQNNNLKMYHFARILMSIALTFIFCGIILQLSNIHERVLDPIKDVIPVNNNDSSIHIDKPNNENDSSLEEKVTSSYTEEENKNLKKKIKNKYGITILYGKDTDYYKIEDIDVISLTDNSMIHDSLIQLEGCLQNYPEGLFQEIRDGGLPLTIQLVHHFSDINVTGITDSNNSYAKISISVSHSFEESFYHESYHYIERYLFKKGANYNTWNAFNPNGFQYGIVDSTLSYSNTFLENSPFVNNYAQMQDTEDRASTFEYMMAIEKAKCLTEGQTVWKKATLIARTIEYILNTVTPSTTEYWERYL